MGRRRGGAVAAIALTAALFGCGKTAPRQASESARPIGTPVALQAPLGLPPVPVPPDNPPTAETIELGRTLYFSPLLSLDGSISCASCHNPAMGFADGRRVSPGVGGKSGARNAPTVLNAAYYTAQFWDGRAATLELQASGPMLNAVEMGHSLEGVERACAGDAKIRGLVEKAYGPGPVTMDKLTKAIASFERTLVSGNSPFDRFLYGGDRKALSAAAQRGLAVFRDAKRGNCAVCHTIEETHALFSDNKFHNLGVGLNAEGELTDQGRERGEFRTPTLRNIALTAPYMHDGSLKTLKDVVDFYVGGGSSNPHLDKEIKPLEHLSKGERADLVAFMESLTGDLPK